MISVIVQRQPADKQGPDISESLITSELVARERGRNEVDYAYSNREIVTGTGPLKDILRPGSMIQVMDLEQGAWKGKLTNFSLKLNRTDSGIDASYSVTIEREVR